MSDTRQPVARIVWVTAAIVVVAIGTVVAAVALGRSESTASKATRTPTESKTSAEETGTSSEQDATPPRLLLHPRTLTIGRSVWEIAADQGRVIPLLIQPNNCAKLVVWDARQRSEIRLDPWPACRKEVGHPYDFDRYSFRAVLNGRSLAVIATTGVSDSCEDILSRVVLPRRDGETIDRYLGGCYAIAGKRIGNLISAGDRVYFNYWSSKRSRPLALLHRSNPAVWVMSIRAGPPRATRWNGVLFDAEGEQVVVRQRRAPIRLGFADQNPADALEFPDATSAVLTSDRLITGNGRELRVYDAGSGQLQATWPLRRDPFDVPNKPDFEPVTVPPPVLADAWDDIVVYVSGRRIHLLRVSDGFDAIVHQAPFYDEYLEFPTLDAKIDESGLFYASSSTPSSGAGGPYGEGKIMFVSANALEAALP